MQKRRDLLLILLYGAALAGLLYLAGRYVLTWLLPFLPALAVGHVAEPFIELCRRKLRLKRCFTAAVLTLVLVLLVVSGTVWLAGRLWQELTGALASLPAFLALLPELTDSVFGRLAHFSAACPAEVRQWVDTAIGFLADELTRWAVSLSSKAVAWVTGAVAFLPEAALFCITTALATFFTTAAYPQVMAFFRRQLPPQHRKTAAAVRDSVLLTLWRWLKAQGILIAVTFAQLLAGFLLLHQPYALLLSILIALIDALPVLGAGTVLLPWALGCFALGYMPKGIALAALYGVLTVVRSILEPKVLSSQAGLSPLPSLLAMYAGFHVGGIAGMILLPVALLLVVQLQNIGLLKLWR